MEKYNAAILGIIKWPLLDIQNDKKKLTNINLSAEFEVNLSAEFEVKGC